MKDYKMRRKDREADESTARKILQCGEYGVLSTVGSDGFPYGVPLNYVFDGEKIYCHCALNVGHKQENLQYCNKISFCVVASSAIVKEKFTSKFASAVVFGTAKKTVGKKQYALEKLVQKYSPEFTEQGMDEIKNAIAHTDIFEISIEKLSAKIHK